MLVKVTKSNSFDTENPLQTSNGRLPINHFTDKSIANGNIDTNHSSPPDVNGSKEAPTKVPDGGWGWFVVLGSCLIQAINGGLEKSKGILYLQLQDKFEQNATTTSWVLIIFSSIGMLFGPAASKLCSRMSFRKVGYLGATMISVGLFTSGFSHTLTLLCITYGLIAGIGRILVFTPSLIIVGTYFQKRLGLAVGLSTAGNGIGSFAFPPLIEVLFETFCFRGFFVILAAITLNLFVCCSLFRPLRRRSKRRKSLSDISIITDGSYPDKLTNLQTDKDTEILNTKTSDTADDCKNMTLIPDFGLFKNFAFTATCLQILFHHMGKQATLMFLPALVVSKGISLVDAALMLSASSVCETVSKFVMSIVLDFEHIKKYRLLVYSCAVVLLGAVLATFPSMSTYAQFIIGSGVYGLIGGVRVQKLLVVIDTHGKENIPDAMGWLCLFQGIGSFIGPTIAALYKDYIGDYDTIIYLSAISHFIGGICMMTGTIWLHRKRQRIPT